MALEITRCESDADYEDWRRVRIAVIPYERTQSLDELRQGDTPDRLLLVAREDGAVVGHGLAALSDTAGGGTVIPRVLAEHRRKGVGTALLDRLTQHVVGLGTPVLRSGADDDGALAFAHRFGFEEVNREVEQTFRITGPIAVPPAPEGVEVVTEQERPGLWAAAYERFGREALAGFAVDTPLDVNPSRWATTWLADPSSSPCTTARSSAVPVSTATPTPRPAPRTG